MTTSIDQQKAEAFAERLLGILNGGALNLMISVGHRTGLFDAMASIPPSTSKEIAAIAGLNERYVREWLGALVTGGIVEYDAERKTYYLPPEHSAFLTRAAVPDNLAAFAQYFAVLGSVEDQIVECFRNGGGVPYSAYPGFHRVMVEESAQTVVSSLTDHILPLAPGLVRSLEEGIDVLDIGCGSGKALVTLARAFPKSRFRGYDISEEAIGNGRADAEALGLSNVEFVVKDVTNLGETEQYDLITAFDAIHDQVKPAQVLKGVREALRPDGVFLMQDIRASSDLENNIDHPIAPLLYTVSCMHCMTVSLSANGEGLGTMWGEEKAREMLQEAGFSSVEVNQLPHDFQNNYFVVRKG